MALKNYQYNRLIQKYEDRQQEIRRTIDNRRTEVYAKVPEYKRLDDQVVDASMACAMIAIGKNKNEALAEREIQKLRITIREFGERKKKLLAENDFPTDYLEPHYTCPDCMDTGYVNGVKCHCFKQAVVDLLYSQSNVQQFIKKENFDSFSFDYYSDKYIDDVTGESALAIMKENYQEAKEFVANFDNDPKNLFFYGNAGLGKTFLSNCIANELLKTGHTVLYLTASQLFDAFAKSMKNEIDEDNLTESQDYILNCDLLIIDDLGTEMPNAFTISRLNMCINDRLLGGHSTIISTNLNPMEIRDTYGERNFSRITGSYSLLHFIGSDIRLQKRFA